MGSNVGCFVYGDFPCARVYGWDVVVSPIVGSFIDAYIRLDGSLYVVSIIC